MAREHGPEPIAIAPLNVTLLEKGESLLAYCTTCKKVVCKGNQTRISQMVMHSQMVDHIEAFVADHVVEVISTGL
jgi:hypothetical protein